MIKIKEGDVVTNLSNLRRTSSFFPSLYFLIIIVLFGTVIKVGLSKISEQRNTLADIKAKEAILADKEKELSRAKSEIVGIFYDPVSIALPEENPVLLSFSQVKLLLDFYLLPLDEYSVRVGAEGEDKIVVNASSFNLSVVGNLDQIISFLKEVENTSPLMSVSKLSFSPEGDVILAEITINSFWSPFAAKIQTDSPLQKITDSERNLLIDLGNFKKPAIPNPSPNGPFQRDNPFSSAL